MSEDPIASTAERTLRLLELLLAEPEGLTPQEMLVRLGMSRSTLFELLRTLKLLGYVEQTEKRGRYRSGRRLAAWRAAPLDARQDLLSAFYQEAGRQNWPETVLLVVEGQEGILILGQVEGTQKIRSVYNTGEISSEISAAQQIFKNPTKEIIQNGYALENDNQLIEIALPICPDGSHPEAAILLSVPAFRYQPDFFHEVWLPELRAMAARLSYRLGAATYTPFSLGILADLTPAVQLSAAKISEFLQGPWTARLACVRPDGKPHVIPVWQQWNGTTFTVLAWQGSQWAEFVRQNPNVSLTIDEPWTPLRRVTARGRAEPLPYPPGSPQLESLLQGMATRYLGSQSLVGSTTHIDAAFTIKVDSLRGFQGLPAGVNN